MYKTKIAVLVILTTGNLHASLEWVKIGLISFPPPALARVAFSCFEVSSTPNGLPVYFFSPSWSLIRVSTLRDRLQVLWPFGRKWRKLVVPTRWQGDECVVEWHKY